MSKKRKKPPDTGEAPKVEQADGGTQEADEEPEPETKQPEPQQSQSSRFPIDADIDLAKNYPLIHEAYVECKLWVETADTNIAQAFLRSVWHIPKKGRRLDGALAAGGCVAGAVVFDPVIGAAAGGALFCLRGAWYAIRSRFPQKDPFAHVPRELRTLWHQQCYRFCCLVEGYNGHVATAMRMLNEARLIPHDDAWQLVYSEHFHKFEVALWIARRRILAIGNTFADMASLDHDQRETCVKEENPLGVIEGRLDPRVAWIEGSHERFSAAKTADEIEKILQMIMLEEELEDFLRDASETFSALGDHDADDVVAQQHGWEDEKKKE